MSELGIAVANTNPMVFEELATSLATLATYARGDMDVPFKEMEHLYRRALQEPPSYEEITSITGHNMETNDRECGRAAWLLANIEDLQVHGVHTLVWHKVKKKYSAPILDQIARATGKPSQLSHEQIQKLGEPLAMIDVVGVKEDAIWLTQVVTSKNVHDSALNRVGRKSGSLFRSVVYRDIAIDDKDLSGLIAAEKQMRAAFPTTDVVTMVLVVHPQLPDFELYHVELNQKSHGKLMLTEERIRKNSIDYADQLRENQDSLFTLPGQIDNALFKGVPPCRGGRTLIMLALAASRQLQSETLELWECKDFTHSLAKEFGYKVQRDKLRHDLDDRLVQQGFFRKHGTQYYVSMRGIARYQYCLAKFTSVGSEDFDLDQLVQQRDRIIAKFGFLI
ncbi:MAG: hypothetical protein KF688_18085 [Pirellulales bacterium]|nr:hypothetical protein [Pirellulales bacterium]